RLWLAGSGVAPNRVRGLAYVAAAYFGARRVLIGGYAGVAMTAASLGLFQSSIAVFGWMTAGARHLADTWGSLQDVSVAISRVLEMLTMPAAERAKNGSLGPRRSVASIALEGVNFGYDPRSRVLNKVWFEARAGELTALAGASGSGKTTIVGLLLRFFEPDSGRILCNGVPIEQFDLPAWRSMLS